MPQRVQADSGFTLIELVVTAAFMGVVIVALMGTFAQVGFLGRDASNLTVATKVAEQEMEVYRNTPFSSLVLGSHDFSANLSPYPALGVPRTAAVVVSQVDPAGLDQIDITVTYTDHGRVQTIGMSTQIAYKGINH